MFGNNLAEFQFRRWNTNAKAPDALKSDDFFLPHSKMGKFRAF
jgi:hypothetical protein